MRLQVQFRGYPTIFQVDTDTANCAVFDNLTATQASAALEEAAMGDEDEYGWIESSVCLGAPEAPRVIKNKCEMQMKTLKGKTAKYEVRNSDGSEIEDHEFGRQGSLCATLKEAEELAALHKIIGTPVIIIEVSE